METTDETERRHLDDKLKQHALQAAYAYEHTLAASGARDSYSLALVGAYLLAKATWVQAKGCGDPDCPCSEREGTDFRDEAQLLLLDALDDIELIETQTEGRA